MARDMEAMDWLGLAAAGVALSALTLAQSGKKAWAADRPVPLMVNILAGLLGVSSALWALYWPLVGVHGLWLASSAYNLGRVMLNRRDIRMAAQAKREAAA